MEQIKRDMDIINIGMSFMFGIIPTANADKRYNKIIPTRPVLIVLEHHKSMENTRKAMFGE
jgi:hypothetical protein